MEDSVLLNIKITPKYRYFLIYNTVATYLFKLLFYLILNLSQIRRCLLTCFIPNNNWCWNFILCNFGVAFSVWWGFLTNRFLAGTGFLPDTVPAEYLLLRLGHSLEHLGLHPYKDHPCVMLCLTLDLTISLFCLQPYWQFPWADNSRFKILVISLWHRLQNLKKKVVMMPTSLKFKLRLILELLIGIWDLCSNSHITWGFALLWHLKYVTIFLSDSEDLWLDRTLPAFLKLSVS